MGRTRRRRTPPRRRVAAPTRDSSELARTPRRALRDAATHRRADPRPGARGESLERYVKRLEKLESLATSFPGVKTTQAIQAGREVRVFVNAHRVSDKKAMRLCHEIAKEVESQLTYPGEIKVTLIRETRVVEYAR